MLPVWYTLSVIFLFGLVIGSFLNVVIYRLHTGRSLNNRSHCLSCGQTLRWYELVPVFSYLVLRGRCRHCGSWIPYRYALVELLTGAAFLLCYSRAEDSVLFVLLALFCSAIIVGVVYDFYHMIIPDEVSYGALAFAILISLYEAVVLSVPGVLFYSLVGAIIIFSLFAGLWYFSGGRAFGFGDAKLSLSLGVLVGVGGVFSLVVLSFWVGAIISLVLLALKKIFAHSGQVLGGVRCVSMKSEIPFAPFLLIAFFLVYFLDINVLTIISNLFSI